MDWKPWVLALTAPLLERHDSIRGVSGTFDRTVAAISWAGDLGLPLQINTLVSAENASDLPAIYELVRSFQVGRCSLFFLISVGRRRVLQPLTSNRAEELMQWVYETSKTAPFVLSTTEAPFYRRVAVQRMRLEGLSGEEISRTKVARSFGVRDGNGIVFVSSAGDICPAGFLPVAEGNVRTHGIADVYRHAPLFQSLHDSGSFKDRCGVCEFRALCTGSRARAFQATGDPLGTDPLCEFVREVRRLA